jgi:hypothetical protein
LQLAALLPVIVLLIIYAHTNIAGPAQYRQVFLPLLLAALISVYVDFLFAGMIEKMVPRS